jgi:hypothetical protein
MWGLKNEGDLEARDGRQQVQASVDVMKTSTPNV